MGDWVLNKGGHWLLTLFIMLGLAGLGFWPQAIWTAGHVCWVGVFGFFLRWFLCWVSRWVTIQLGALRQMPFIFQEVPTRCLNFLASSSLHGNMWSAQQRSGSGGGNWTWFCTFAMNAHPSPRFTSTGCRLWVILVLLCGLLRVGEAAHPGPPAGTWTLGIANPSGLNGKLDQVAHLPGDAWLLTETHLSQQGASTFLKGLRMLQSPWRYAIVGAPCQARHKTDTGVHAGVMLVSKFPSRALPHGFPPEVYDTARVQVVGMAVADTWITMGLLYGLPCNAHHKQAKFQTETLLAELIDRVGCQATGPRAVGGDFNYGPDELEQLDRLRQLGFREVQDLRAWRFGISAEATGRGVCRIDQLWISPELQQAYLATQVSFDHWADHAAVTATFALDCLTVTVNSWRAPQPFPWPCDWSCALDLDFQADLTSTYASFWTQVEGQAKCWVQHAGGQVSRKQCGRALTLSPSPTKEYLCPVKKGRKGDVQPSFHGVSLQHARFFRQLRRLQALCRALQKGVASWNAKCNCDETWRAIRLAPGFDGGFGLWWGAHGLEPALSGPLPLFCPDLEFSQGLFVGFQGFITRYEQGLISQRYQFATKRRETNLAHVFRDCKEDPLPQADTLVERLDVPIEEVRPEDLSVVLTRPVQLLPDLPVVVGGKVVEVVAHAEDQLWLSDVAGVTEGDWISQERAVVSDAAILDSFAQAWGPRWMKLSHVVPGQWDQISDFLVHTVRPIAWNCQPWNVARFQQAVKHKKPRAAKGPDGVSQPDLCALPPAACQAMVSLFQTVEAGSRWPVQLASGFVSSLAKTPLAQTVNEFRPVVVYSLAYRVWSTERAREALRSLLPVLPHSVRGGVPSRQAKSIWFELATVLEGAYLSGEPVHGLLLDIQKCFNNIPRAPLWLALVRLGFPEPVLRAWVSFVAAQTRRFRVRRSVGDPLSSNCGLPEGCALSVFGMAVIDWMLDWWLKAL